MLCDKCVARSDRAETDNLVRKKILQLDRAELIQLLVDADIAFAEVNDMAALSAHTNLHRTTIETPYGEVEIPLPGASIVGAPRQLGGVR
jgi:itaconate CoA-transferase